MTNASETHGANPLPASFCRRSLRASCAGTTIVEAVIAAGVIVVAFAGLFQISVRSMSMLKMQSEMAAASEVIQERIDSIRSLAWGNLTNGVNATTYDYILADATDGNVTKSATGILNNSPGSAGALNSAVETITISAYPPDASAPASFTVTNQGGTVTVTPAGGSDLSAQDMVRVDTQLQWREARSGRTRTQATSFIVTQEGVGK